MRRLWLSLFIIYALLIPAEILAHSVGQPPYFKLNGKYSALYPVGARATVDSFVLPQDMAPEIYLVNQPILFEFDESQMPVSPELLKKMSFNWDFGDGETGTGIKNTHSYKKMGSYILTIHAKFSQHALAGGTPLIQSVLVNIIPEKGFMLPVADIRINNQKPSDERNKTYLLNIREDMKFDGSWSKSDRSRIISYFWDMGDNTSSHEVSFIHNYKDPYFGASPILRVTDENGFIGDTAVTVNHMVTKTNKPIVSQEKKMGIWPVATIVVGLLVIGLCVYWVVKNKRQKK